MQPKRTKIVNYYDCYEVGYIKLYCVGQGDPAGQNIKVIIKTLNKQGVEDLAKKYNINFVDFKDIWATGYYIREVETTKDPELITGELDKLENVFKEEKELNELKDRFTGVRYEVLTRNFIGDEDDLKNDLLNQEYYKLNNDIIRLDHKLHSFYMISHWVFIATSN